MYYKGSNDDGPISLSVIGHNQEQLSVDIIYDLPKDILRAYTVIFQSEHINGSEAKIFDHQGNMIFHGVYQSNSMFLFDTTGRPYTDDFMKFHLDFSSIRSDFVPANVSIVSLAARDNATIRGDYQYGLLGLLFICFSFIDIKFPLFFFKLRHNLNVNNPEPSDFYISIQHLSWIIMPIVGVIFMVIALYKHL